MSENHKKTCKYLNYVEHLFILASTVTGCVSISAFASWFCVPFGVPTVVIRIRTITAGMKNYKLIIMKKKKHD